MSYLDRRSLLLALSGGAVVSACRTVSNSKIASTSAPGLAPVVRKRWVSGTMQEHQQKYIKAVELLKANDAKFPLVTVQKAVGMGTSGKAFPEGYFLSWKGLVQIHYASCQHQSWYLLPYHRLYLLYFEAACQTVLGDPTFALPYWDWTENRSVPDEFYDTAALQEVRILRKAEALPSEAKVDSGEIQASMNYDFEKFSSFKLELPNPFTSGGGGSGFGAGAGRQGAFEAGPHNGVHNFVGGMMGDPKSSPTDPLFWLHHSNIDRLWGIWLTKNADKVLPFLTLDPEEARATEGFRKAWGETVVSLDMALNRPWGGEEATERQKANKPSGLTPDYEMVLAVFNQIRLNPPKPIAASEKNHSGQTAATCRDLIAADRLPYFYDTDPQSVAQTMSISLALKNAKPEMLKRPKERLVNGAALVLKSEVTSTLTVPAIDKRYFPSLSIQFKNLPVPMDAELRSRLAIYYFIVRSSSQTDLPKILGKDSQDLSSFAGSQTLFLVDHSHGGTEMPAHTVSGLIDISRWAGKANAESLMSGQYLIKAYAVDTKNAFKAVEVFNDSDYTELSIRYISEL